MTALIRDMLGSFSDCFLGVDGSSLWVGDSDIGMDAFGLGIVSFGSLEFLNDVVALTLYIKIGLASSGPVAFSMWFCG